MGTVPASLLTYAAALALQPDLIINAGTAGGFQVLHYFLSSHLVDFAVLSSHIRCCGHICRFKQSNA